MGRWLLIATCIYVFASLVVDRAHAIPVTNFTDGCSNLFKVRPTDGAIESSRSLSTSLQGQDLS